MHGLEQDLIPNKQHCFSTLVGSIRAVYNIPYTSIYLSECNGIPVYTAVYTSRSRSKYHNIYHSIYHGMYHRRCSMYHRRLPSRHKAALDMVSLDPPCAVPPLCSFPLHVHSGEYSSVPNTSPWSVTYFWGFEPALVSYWEPGRRSAASSVRFPLAPNLDAMRCAERSPDRSGDSPNAALRSPDRQIHLAPDAALQAICGALCVAEELC